MGLAAVAAGQAWLDADRDYRADLAEKRRLVREHRRQVFVERPGSRPAQTEAADHVLEELERVAPACAADPPDEDAPLVRAAQVVQEDLCVLEGPGAWRLVAAVVCFPTRWDLPSKLGQPLAAVHARVPGYAGELAASADRFLDRMVPGRVFRRSNWSLVDDPALFQPGGKLRCEPNRDVDATNVGERVWIRTEWQTLQRLPQTGAVLFTIRVYRTPLRALEADRESARALRASLASMSDAFLLYKSFPPIADAVHVYLDALG